MTNGVEESTIDLAVSQDSEPEGLTEQDPTENEEVPDQLNSELAYAQRVEKACLLLLHNSASRPILYRILKICVPEQIRLNDLEEQIQLQPEFAGVVHSPYFLIQWLVNVEALDVFILDEEGNEIVSEQLEGLTEDEIDDLIADEAYKTSDIGLEVIDEFSPQSRLIEMLNIVPERYDTYVELLEFLTEKRSLSEIEKLLRGRDVLMSGRKPGDIPMQPSVFIDKLADSGGIVFDKGWQITSEGKELLEVIIDKRS